MLNEIMSRIHTLDKSSPKDFLGIQIELRTLIIECERKIVQNRNKVKGLKWSKRNYAKSVDKSILKINKYERIIDRFNRRQDAIQYERMKLKFLGDCIAYKVYEEFDIRQLSKNNDPGFIFDKEGSEFEVEVALEHAKDGYYVLLHDITNCLRVGDLSIVSNEGKPVMIECKETRTGELKINDRLIRQVERMMSIDSIMKSEVNTEVKSVNTEMLYKYNLPTEIIEIKAEVIYHYSVLEKLCQTENNFEVIEVEPGLTYAVVKDGYEEDLYRELEVRFENCSILSSNLLRRIEGEFENIPPFGIGIKSSKVLIEIFDVDIIAFIFIDMNIVQELFKNLGCEDGVELVGNDENIEYVRVIGRNSQIGPRIFNRVRYGLLSLETAVLQIVELINYQSSTKPN